MSPIEIVTMFLIGLLVLLGAFALLQLVRQARAQPNVEPGVAEMLDALDKYVYAGIIAGEKLAIQGLNELDAAISGAEKAQIANSVYNALPDTIMVGETPIPLKLVKTLVTPEAFAAAVHSAYEATHSFILRNQDYLKAQVEALEPANDPPKPPIEVARTADRILYSDGTQVFIKPETPDPLAIPPTGGDSVPGANG